MTKFEVAPFIGPLPLRFGMSPGDVASILGPPKASSIDFLGDREEERDGLNLGYARGTDQLQEVVFSPGTTLVFQGMELLTSPDPIAWLRRFDPKPQLWVGLVVFPALGIRVSGYHDDDDSQKAIGVARRGSWDAYQDDFEPFT